MYQPKTSQRCGCKRGVQRDNCPNCEGTGWVVDFRAIRERTKTRISNAAFNALQSISDADYERAAEDAERVANAREDWQP